MIRSRYERLPLSDIKPAGMIMNLLMKQAAGLSGHLPELFPDVGPASAWLGGTGEGWERGPYYLDGIVPLAFLTGDAVLMRRVVTWIEAILASQTEDGFFGPAGNDDWWPRFVAVKAIVQYAIATGSDRAAVFLRRFCDHMIACIERRPPAFWGYARGLEAFPAIRFVRERTKDPKYDVLLETLVRLTYPWSAFFRSFPYPEPTTRYLNRTLFLALKPILALYDAIGKKRKTLPAPKSAEQIAKDNAKKGTMRYLTTHGVNLAMAIKYPVYEAFLQGKTDAEPALSALAAVRRFHGTAAGVFSSDEHLNGPLPDCGIELCAVVELMHSLEETLVLTGDPQVADTLERLAWNTLPATFTNDLCGHQYLQQTDQPEATVKRRRFYDSGPRSTTFGVAPNYGCCAANMHQGFPKFAASAVLRNEGGATVFLYAAGTYRIGGPRGSATLEIATGYPFEDGARITVAACDAPSMTLSARRPFDAKMRCNGDSVPAGAGCVAITESMKTGDVFDLAFDWPVETRVNADGSASVFCGPLLYCQKLKAHETYLGGVRPFHDRAFESLEKDRYGLLVKDGQVLVEGFRKGVIDADFYQNDRGVDVAAISLSTNTRVVLPLHPYGTATLRHTHFKTREEPR
ncbi:MAG TPA: hypothetical protein DCR44_08310 [Acholeplasmatales bacterium]|nr:MAG: hypothetical protein A2Y16_02910 [Tenericutes bacterium GWF2_57_13]HAQ57369.1 hypothetical protein [Acholeplasmatales bacterium]